MGFYSKVPFLLRSTNSLCIKCIIRLKSTVLRKRRVENVLQHNLSHHVNVDVPLTQNSVGAGAKIYMGLTVSGSVNKRTRTIRKLKGTPSTPAPGCGL